jgi:hypothetical protein
MARYFFHVMNGIAELDTDGVELPGLPEVRVEAVRASASMLSAGDQNWSGRAWQMVVCDEAGTIVFGTSFSVDHHGFS